MTFIKRTICVIFQIVIFHEETFTVERISWCEDLEMSLWEPKLQMVKVCERTMTYSKEDFYLIKLSYTPLRVTGLQTLNYMKSVQWDFNWILHMKETTYIEHKCTDLEQHHLRL